MSDADLGIGDNVRTQRAVNGHGRLPEGFWIADSREHDDGMYEDTEFGRERYPGLVSLSFIRSAIKRTAKVWCTFGLVGLLAGIGLFVARPAGYKATTSLYLAQPPNAQPGWITDDQAIAQSRTVAGIALKKLGLKEDPSSFVSDYTVVATTDRILMLTVKASSTHDALREARALANAFLSFQTTILDKQDKLVDAALQKQVTSARHDLDVINNQIATIQSEPVSPKQQGQLHSLRVKRGDASATLTQLKQTVTNAQATSEAATATAIKYSRVLDPAALLKQSVKRRIALYGGGGLLAGLVLGLGIVIVTAVVSTRLRRRDDVARALGAPVRLSIAKGRLKRRRLHRAGLATAEDRNMSRIIAHLSTAVAPTAGGFASLAVVPADETEVAASCLASLAVSCAQQGLRVVMADLCANSPAANLLGVPEPGVGEVVVGDARLVVVVPEGEDVLPTGPLSSRSLQSPGSDPLASACASSDLLLTLARLDPALGGDFLAEWTSTAVAFVTAGRSSAERVHAVGEMVRFAGVLELSAVLVGADKSDESLGVVVGSQVAVS